MGRPVRTLSLGQRMRADLAAAMAHAPKVLYLDEPTIGLDIVVKDQIRQAIRDFRNESGMTVMLTTHDMGDIEELCPRILVIDQGKLIYDGSIDYLRSTYGTTRVLELDVKEGQDIDLPRLKRSLARAGKGLEIGLEGRTLSISHDSGKVDTVKLIPRALEAVPSADIRIVETPVAEIIKRIYKGSLEGRPMGDLAEGPSAIARKRTVSARTRSKRVESGR
jgi:ABC-2 type transport system ATP-binding protein